MFTNTIYRFFLEKLGDGDVSTFVGSAGELFYDPNVGAIRLSDGETPGGIPASFPGELLGVTAGTGLSGGGVSGVVTLDLEIASETEIGGILPGNNFFISPDGTLNNTVVIDEPDGQSLTLLADPLVLGGGQNLPIGTKANIPTNDTVELYNITHAGVSTNWSNTDDNQFVTKRYVDDQDGLLIPSGVVEYFAGSTAPQGWFECNGQAVSRTTYASLFAAIGTTWGGGDGSSTFNVPDLRGEFIRGWDNGRNVDPNRQFASSQGHQFEDHTHEVGYSIVVGSGNHLYRGLRTGDAQTSGAATGNRGAETRPRNVALLPIIKI